MKKIVTLKFPETEMQRLAEFICSNNQFWVICSWSKDDFVGSTYVVVILSVNNDTDYSLLESKFSKYIKNKKEIA